MPVEESGNMIMVWDKVLGLDLFPQEVYDKEIKFYLTKQNELDYH